MSLRQDGTSVCSSVSMCIRKYILHSVRMCIRKYRNVTFYSYTNECKCTVCVSILSYVCTHCIVFVVWHVPYATCVHILCVYWWVVFVYTCITFYIFINYDMYGRAHMDVCQCIIYVISMCILYLKISAYSATRTRRAREQVAPESLISYQPCSNWSISVRSALSSD
jgi:hypothetical protein